MSDFFGSLNSSNVRFTDARINGDGPLPTNLSGPEGISGDPDGRYNFNTDLLSNITLYAGLQACRMGSDRNYQQIPHRKQFPPLTEIQDRRATVTDALHTVNNIQVILVCCRPGDRGGGTETPAASVPRHKVQARHARYSEIRNP